MVSDKVFTERNRLLAMEFLAWVVTRVQSGKCLTFGYRYDPRKDILSYQPAVAWLEWEMGRAAVGSPRTDPGVIAEAVLTLPCMMGNKHVWPAIHIPHAYLLGIDCPSSLRDETRLAGRLEYKPKEAA